MQSEVGCEAFVPACRPPALHLPPGLTLRPRKLSLLPSQQIRKLRRELESSQEKVATLTSQLSANVSEIQAVTVSKVR